MWFLIEIKYLKNCNERGAYMYRDFYFKVFSLNFKIFVLDEDLTSAVEMKIGNESSKQKEFKEEQLRFRYTILKRAIQGHNFFVINFIVSLTMFCWLLTKQFKFGRK